MSDKPLEWVGQGAIVGSRMYLVWSDGTACWTETGHWQDVPGPYDGTIETAKKRCEEHRRKLMEVEAGS